MLGWFPTPYPDELFYSLCARYAEVVRYPSKTGVQLDLYGNEHFYSLLLPTSLGNFIERLPKNYCLTLDKLIYNHTPFPYFTSFLNSERTQNTYLEMTKPGSSKTHALTKVNSPYIKSKEFLTVCPQCIASELDAGHPPYWHRLHQLPGVEICPTHLNFLQSTGVPLRGASKSRLFISASEAVSCLDFNVIKINFNDPLHQILLNLAINTSKILELDKTRYNTTEINKAYSRVLGEKGCNRRNGCVSSPDFINFMRKKIPAPLVDLLDCGFKEGNQQNWYLRITSQLKTGQATPPPLQHLLVINALGLNITDFREICSQIKSLKAPTPIVDTFGSGKFPCRNPVCKDFEKLVIKIFKYRTKVT